MSNVIYLPVRRPQRHPAIVFLENDWRRTVNDFRASIKLLRDYHQFRRLGLKRRKALSSARNAL